MTINKIGMFKNKFFKFWASTIMAFGIFALTTQAANAGYTLSKVDTNGSVGKYTALRLQDKTKPVMAYYDSTNKQVKFAVCSNAVCDDASLQPDDTSVGMSDPGTAVDVGVNGDGYPYAVYSYQMNGAKEVVIAACSSADCSNGFPDAYTVSNFTSDTTDVATTMYKGNPIVFYKYSDTVLYVLQCDGDLPGCTQKKTGLILLDDGYTQPTDLNIMVGDDGKAMISYMVTDGTTSELRLIRCNDVACSKGTTGGLAPVTIAQSTGKGLLGNSMTLNSSGVPIFGYYSSQDKLGYISTCNNKSCATPSAKIFYSGTGKFGSLDVVTNKNGLPVVSFAATKSSDSSKYRLKAATCTDTTCASVGTVSVDTSGNVGLYNSVAVNSDNKVVISYYDSGNKDLKLALQN